MQPWLPRYTQSRRWPDHLLASCPPQCGSRVRTHGLQSCPQHNGCGGVAIAVIPQHNGSAQNDRWQVRLDDGTELALRSTNLQLEDPPLPLHIYTSMGPAEWDYLNDRLPQHLRPMRQKFQTRMLRQIEEDLVPEFHDFSERLQAPGILPQPEAVGVMHHRHAQRVSLEKLLIIPEGALAANPLLNLPICVVLERAIDARRIHPRSLLSYALTCRAWAAFVRAWLVSAHARPFWQRFCVATLPEGVVLHPELCTKELLLEWVRLRPAVGTRQHWYLRGMGLASMPGVVGSDALPEGSMSELELAVLLGQLFVLWWNVGVDHDSPCFVGWMRLYFRPWLDGPTHVTEAAPGEWSNADRTPRSLLASICDCIQDFRGLMQPPAHMDEQLLRTLRALVTRFHLDQKPRDVQWRYMTMSSAQNSSFYELLRRYAPLFPQGSDREPRRPMAPIYASGRRRHSYPLPRPLVYPLLPSPYNPLLVLDRGNTDTTQEFWEFDEHVQRHLWVDPGDESMEGWEDEGEEDEADEDDEDDEDEDGEEGLGVPVYPRFGSADYLSVCLEALQASAEDQDDEDAG
jgi:hypothetical protein